MPTDTPPTGEQLRAMFQAARREHRGLSYHTYRSVGSDKGFPDVVDLPRGGTVSYVEFKGEGERLLPEQEQWRDALVAAGERYYICRPRNATGVAKALGLLRLIQELAALGCGDGPAAPGAKPRFDPDTATSGEFVAELGRLGVDHTTVFEAVARGPATLLALYHDELNSKQPRRRGGER